MDTSQEAAAAEAEVNVESAAAAPETSGTPEQEIVTEEMDVEQADPAEKKDEQVSAPEAPQDEVPVNLSELVKSGDFTKAAEEIVVISGGDRAAALLFRNNVSAIELPEAL